MAFSSVTRPFLLARGRLATPIDAGAQKASKARGFLCFQCASHGSPLVLLCVEPWVILEARWKRILTIFAPWTFLHTQGHEAPRIGSASTHRASLHTPRKLTGFCIAELSRPSANFRPEHPQQKCANSLATRSPGRRGRAPQSGW